MAKILLSALAARRGGVVLYVRNIARSFPRDCDDRLSILSREPIEGLSDRPDIAWIRAPRWTRLPVPRFLIGFFYFRFIWPRRREFDVVFYAGGSFDVALPKRAARVVIFQNMLPFDRESRRRYPLGWMRLRHWLLWFVQGWAMCRADLVIFISEHGRQVIDKAFRRRGRATVIRHGLTRDAVPRVRETVRRLPDRFVLYVSSIDAYKAQVELVEAWALLHRSRATKERLLLVGPEYRPYAHRVREAIQRCGMQDEVILLGAIGHEEVLGLAERAELNLFLSACENCPNTLIELMGAGRPLLISSRQPMPELGGPELAYVDPYDVPAVARAIARMLDDPELCRSLAEAAERRSRMFNWDETGAATWKAIQAMAVREASAPATSGRPVTARR